MLAQARTIWNGLYDLFADSGFSMAGAVSFSFVLALFPFCIFLGAFAGYFGGDALARAAVAQLFDVVPTPVAKVLEPEVMAVMGQSRFGLLTFGALIALFFATSAIESLRAALNIAYRVKETKSYPACLAQSAIIVLLSALGMLAIAWGVVVGPRMLSQIKPRWLLWLADQSWLSTIIRYCIVIAIIGVQLFTYHLWLTAGRRRVADVWPGVLLSILLWILAAKLFSNWLLINDYSRFYAGLTSVMSALIFFQVTAIVIILGAEVNRAMIEVRGRRDNGHAKAGSDELIPDQSL
jgi:membrane protein